MIYETGGGRWKKWENLSNVAPEKAMKMLIVEHEMNTK